MDTDNRFRIESIPPTEIRQLLSSGLQTTGYHYDHTLRPRYERVRIDSIYRFQPNSVGSVYLLVGWWDDKYLVSFQTLNQHARLVMFFPRREVFSNVHDRRSELSRYVRKRLFIDTPEILHEVVSDAIKLDASRAWRSANLP